MPRLLLLAWALLLGACASRPLPKYQAPMPRAAVQKVRTTAYTHTESDHLQHARRTALGTQLRYGEVRSAAADWSRWPAGTLFRVVETGEIREVDDYGWALSGTNTIDFYQPSRSSMNAWGVRNVTIEILRWGDEWKSYAVLDPRKKHRHVKRMLQQIDQRYSRRRETPKPVVTPVEPAPLEPAAPTVVQTQVVRAEPVRTSARPVTRPFYQ